MNDAELGPLAFWIVSGLGFLSGLVSLWAFRRWSDPKKIRLAINKIVAHLLEFRLYADEPALLIGTQRDLLLANGVFLRELIGPTLLLAVPFSLLLLGMDAVFAKAPLQLEKPAIVTIQCRLSTNSMPTVQLLAPNGIQVETPPVRLVGGTQICWRVRPHRSVRGFLKFRSEDGLITKSISAGGRLQWLSPMRAGSLPGFLSSPLETPLTNPSVYSISLTYPPAHIFGASWLTWYSMALLAGGLLYALALR